MKFPFKAFNSNYEQKSINCILFAFSLHTFFSFVCLWEAVVNKLFVQWSVKWIPWLEGRPPVTFMWPRDVQTRWEGGACSAVISSESSVGVDGKLHYFLFSFYTLSISPPPLFRSLFLSLSLSLLYLCFVSNIYNALYVFFCVFLYHYLIFYIILFINILYFIILCDILCNFNFIFCYLVNLCVYSIWPQGTPMPNKCNPSIKQSISLAPGGCYP